MSKCILHIGMSKTGSTAIQRTLYLDRYKDANYLYANFGIDESNHGRAVYMLFSPKNQYRLRRYVQSTHPSATNEFRAQMFKHLESQTKQSNLPVVISGERIMYMSKKYLLEIKKYLQQIFSEISVVAYIREPISYMSCKFQEILKTQYREIDLEKVYPNYQSAFEKFDQLFGRKNVTLRLYDRDKFQNGCVVEDFCNLNGITIRQKPNKVFNASLSAAATCLLYTFRKFGKRKLRRERTFMEYKRHVALIRSLHKIKDIKFNFHPELYQPIIHNNLEDINWIENRLQASLSGNNHSAKCGVRTEKDLFNYNEQALKWVESHLPGSTLSSNIEPAQMALYMSRIHKSLVPD